MKKQLRSVPCRSVQDRGDQPRRRWGERTQYIAKYDVSCNGVAHSFDLACLGGDRELS